MTRRADWRRESNRKSKQHTTEILWSRERSDSSFEQALTATYERKLSRFDETCSSSSWGFDDFEARSVERIAASLNAIDEALYEGKHLPTLNQELFDECQKWNKAFPYLRLQGEQILPNPKCNTKSPSIVEISDSADHGQSRFFTESELADDASPVSIKSSSSENSLESTHEIILQDGEPANDSKRRLSHDTSEYRSFSVRQLKENVLEQLSAHIWANLISKLSKSNEIQGTKKSERLPPITASSGQCSYVHSQTKGKNPVVDFPHLEDVLIVSPKVLLPRSESRVSSRTEGTARPHTGWSITSRSSVGSTSTSHFHLPVSREKRNKKNFGFPEQTEVRKIMEKDMDLFSLYLPVVEEDNPVLHNGLQGLHIEPETKNASKLISYNALNFVEKPQNFLPPIDDRDRTFYNMKNIQCPVSYRSPYENVYNHNRCAIYARNLNRPCSRPNTSTNNKDLSIDELSKMAMFSNPKKVSEESPLKSHISSYTAHRSKNLVNLLPIVTSLEPKVVEKKKAEQRMHRKK